MDNNRRRIELLNSLLLEFSRHADLVLRRRDRHGRQHLSRRPQWRAHADAMDIGPQCRIFTVRSRAALSAGGDGPHLRLQAINVEAQQSDPSSLLQWTRNMIALRKLFQVFGRGTLTFLNPANRKILAYLRDLDRGDGFHETVLCVANLSRFAQPVTLDLADYAGFDPVEMLGYVPFPGHHRGALLAHAGAILLSLAGIAGIWHVRRSFPPNWQVNLPPKPKAKAALPTLARSWASFWRARALAFWNRLSLDWLPRQRWFGAKTRTIEAVRVSRWVEIAPERVCVL